MLRPRIIPCLLLQNGALVKTVRFGEGKYIGDPLNAVRIFNEKEVDELIVLDIDATVMDRRPDEALLARLAAESRMPLCYGGGVKSVDQVERLIALGFEKISIGAAAVENPGFVEAAAARVGSQSVVGVIDVLACGYGGRREVLTRRGQRHTGLDPVEFARSLQHLGVGEILINSIDRDGMMNGYDLDLVDNMIQAVDVPLTVLGGAGSLEHVRALVARHPVIGAAAGSLFVFKGKYKAVLINYPKHSERDDLLFESGERR